MAVTNSCTHTLAPRFDMAIVATTGSLANLTAGGGGNALTTVTNGTYPYNITGTLTNNTDNAIVIEYRVTPRLTGCSNGTNVVATVTIEPTPKAAISNSTQTLCDGAALTAMAVTNSCTHTLAPRFDMAIVATTGSLANLTAGGGGNALTTVTNGTYPYNITGTLTNNTDNAIVIEYRVTPRLTGCSNGTNVVATVTIEPTPKAAISNSTQTLCDGASLTAMSVTNSCTHTLSPTFDMAIVATTGSLANLTAGGGGNALTTVTGVHIRISINGSLTNNTDNAIVIEYRVTPKLSGGCANGTNAVATVTIEPTPKAAISNSTQTLCDGAALTAMAVTNSCTHTLAPRFDMAIVATTGSLANLTAGGGGNALTTVTNGTYPYNITGTLTNNTDNAIVIEYRVTPRLTGCSNGTNVVATVTIEPTPKAVISNNTQTICNGSCTYSNGCHQMHAPHTLAPAFDMTIVATTGNLANLTATGNALTTVPGGVYPYTITGTLTNSTNDFIVIEYRVTPKLTGCGDGANTVATVTIRPTLNPTIGGTVIVCQDQASPDITFTNNVNLPVTVYYNINLGASTPINIAANSTATVSVSTAAFGSFYI